MKFLEKTAVVKNKTMKTDEEKYLDHWNKIEVRQKVEGGSRKFNSKRVVTRNMTAEEQT